MDFSLDETQASIAELARNIFTEHERHKELEAAGQTFDAELWSALVSSGLLSVGIEDGGFVDQCIVLVEQGRAVAPVPLWAHLVASTALGASSEGVVSLGFADGDVWRAPAVDVAAQLVAVDSGSVWVFERPFDADPYLTTAGNEFAVRAEPSDQLYVDVDPDDVWRRAVVARCALAVGIAERSLELTAAYTSERKQFERPLGSFQAVQQRAADAYIDVEAMRMTMWQAAWRIDEGLDAQHAVDVAMFWAAEAGQRVVSTAQHLHGGMGTDIDYPLFRYTLWAKEIELGFGGATATLARMGEELAT